MTQLAPDTKALLAPLIGLTTDDPSQYFVSVLEVLSGGYETNVPALLGYFDTMLSLVSRISLHDSAIGQLTDKLAHDIPALNTSLKASGGTPARTESYEALARAAVDLHTAAELREQRFAELRRLVGATTRAAYHLSGSDEPVHLNANEGGTGPTGGTQL